MYTTTIQNYTFSIRFKISISPFKSYGKCVVLNSCGIHFYYNCDVFTYTYGINDTDAIKG